ncbi:putative transporter [Chaetomidium leptoderma]|uniref:Transporter n=1 Tax=Chaetomidium leptoderma TaxID=669021 RepID=A0AAN6VEH5_9PEZI|nr:putative transporter [Chaetomidium leptoderma]
MASLATPETTPLLAAEPQAERREVVDGKTKEDVSRPPGGGCTFEPGDLSNPLEWSPAFKQGIVALLAALGFMVTFTCMSVVPVANKIAADLDGAHSSADTFSSVLPVTIWEVGEAVGPLLIAPLSEMYGRSPVMNAANVLFITSTALAALSPSMAVFVASRALTGMAVASNVLGPAIIGDIFAPEHRGTALSLVGILPLLGGTVGPVVSGAVAQSWGWRAVLRVCVVLAAVCAAVFFAYFRETYGPVILRRVGRRTEAKLGATKKHGGGDGGGYGTVPTATATATKDHADHEGGAVGDTQSVGMLASIARPASVLFGSSVIACLALFGSSVFAHFYILATTLPGILQERYGLSPAATGSAFLSNGVGSAIAILLCKVWLDKIYVKLRSANDGVGLPEHRLPMAVAGAFLLPVALLMYGWCAQLTLPLPFLLATVVLIRICIVTVHVPLMVYVVDACGIYSASAFTGVTVVRCLAGAFLPLGTAQLIQDVGYGWGFTVLSVLSLVFAIVPLLLLRYGSRWRQSSRYTQG